MQQLLYGTTEIRMSTR